MPAPPVIPDPALFLHVPLVDPALILRLVEVHAPESECLEFKGPFWKNVKDETGRVTSYAKEEAGKDIAALANATGGDIIVGIVDGQGRAARFSDDPLPANARKELDDLLEQSLLPVGVMNTLRVQRVELGEVGGAPRSVLVVSVPPWPHGVVAVRRAEGIRSFSFPYRSGSDTRFMEIDKMLATSDAANRSVYLKLLALKGKVMPNVRFVGEVGWEVAAERGRVPGGASHGRLVEMTDTVASFEMTVAHQIAEGFFHARAMTLAGPLTRGFSGERLEIDEDQIPSICWEQARTDARRVMADTGVMLTLPHSLIADAWMAGGPAVLHILLRGGVRFVEDRWVPTGAVG